MSRTLIALGYAFCWGVGVTLTKVALSEITATTLLIIQLSASVLFLSVLCWLFDRRMPCAWIDLKQGLAGVFEPALAYMVGIFGVKMTTATNATLIGSSEVILTILGAAWFLKEPLTRWKLLLAGISCLGLLLLMLPDAETIGRASISGDLLVLLGTLFAVCYVLFSKKQIATVNPLHLTASQQWVGLIVTVCGFGLLSMVEPSYEITARAISLPFWLLAIGSGIMQYALAFLLYLIALQNTPASHAAFFVGLIPVFGVISAIVILGEQPSLTQWLGAVLLIGASYGVNR